MKELIDSFLQPSSVLAAQRDRPAWVLPASVLVVLTVLTTYLYFDKVDMGWFLEQSMLQSGREVSERELNALRAAPGGGFIKWSGSISAGLGIMFMLLVSAVYLLLAGKVTGVAVSFKQGFSLATWSAMPLALSSLVMLSGVLGMEPQTRIDMLAWTSVHPLLVRLEPDSPWFSLATSFNLLAIWGVFLTALGWKLWSSAKSWRGPMIVAVLPSILVYGAMALRALLS